MRNITLFNLCEISNSILVRTQFGQGVAKKKKKMWVFHKYIVLKFFSCKNFELRESIFKLMNACSQFKNHWHKQQLIYHMGVVTSAQHWRDHLLQRRMGAESGSNPTQNRVLRPTSPPERIQPSATKTHHNNNKEKQHYILNNWKRSAHV